VISRITDQMIVSNSQSNLQTQLQQLAVLQAQSSSGKAISKPSDNPTGIAMSLALKRQQATNTQYANNATDATNWLTSVSGALSTSVTSLQSVRSLVVGSGDATLSATAKASIVSQLQGLKAQLLGQANTTYLGRPVFAGNSDAGAAFDDTTYAYNGTAGATVSRTIGDTSTVAVSGDGAAAYGTGSTSVFALIDNIVSGIQAGTDVTGQLANIDSSISAVSNQQAAVSASYNEVQKGQALLTTQAANLTNERSSVDNVDLTKTLVELSSQQNAYQAALGVTSKALQPTLMSFLS
jgi:flagellar hook-associated protein 3 FlgL